MLSGRDTLRQLDSTLQGARSDLRRLEHELQRASDALAKNRVAQNGALKRLAVLRLDALQSGNIKKNLDSVDYQVDELLRDRESTIARLEKDVREKESQLDNLEAKRDEHHDIVEAKGEALANREATVQASLSDDAEFQAQLTATQVADAIAVSAADKATLAQSDRQEKGEPYETSELFSYLWSRGYGTSSYRAGPLARLLDAWVARLCDFEEARRNYWMLLEIPKRLQAHAERVADLAEDELSQLQSLERAAAKSGGVPAAADELAEAERIQDLLDEEISECEAQRHVLRSNIAKFAVSDDDYTMQCLQLLSDGMARRDVYQLTRLAGSTLTLEDDAEVDTLRQLRRADDQLQSELNQHRDLLYEHQKRQKQLEDVRKNFKRHRFDDRRSSFGKGDLLAMMMRQVLGGALQGGSLWDAIRRQQKYNDVGGAWPDFGSGGVVRGGRRKRTNRPTWHWPGRSRRGNSGGGGFRLPPAAKRGRSRNRGGFRTGGSF